MKHLLLFLLQAKESDLRLNWCSNHNISVRAINEGDFTSVFRTKSIKTPPPIVSGNITFSKVKATKNTIEISIPAIDNNDNNNDDNTNNKMLVYILVSENNPNEVLQTFLQKLKQSKFIFPHLLIVNNINMIKSTLLICIWSNGKNIFLPRYYFLKILTPITFI